MGTRGLIGIKQDGVEHGIYVHYDAYPDGLGKDFVAFVSKLAADKERLQCFKNMMRLVEWVDIESEPSEAVQQAYKLAGFADLNVSRRTTKDWYCLLRNVQGVDSFERVLDGSLKHLVEYIAFKNKGLCEYAYILDLDDHHVSFYDYDKCVGHRHLSNLEHWEEMFLEPEERAARERELTQGVTAPLKLFRLYRRESRHGEVWGAVTWAKDADQARELVAAEARESVDAWRGVECEELTPPSAPETVLLAVAGG